MIRNSMKKINWFLVHAKLMNYKLNAMLTRKREIFTITTGKKKKKQNTNFMLYTS